MTPIDRLKQSWIEYVHCPDDPNILAQRRMEYLGHCRNCMGDLLRLVDAVELWEKTAKHSFDCYEWKVSEALAKLKEDE